jgi:hypothetical protein
MVNCGDIQRLLNHTWQSSRVVVDIDGVEHAVTSAESAYDGPDGARKLVIKFGPAEDTASKRRGRPRKEEV